MRSLFLTPALLALSVLWGASAFCSDIVVPSDVDPANIVQIGKTDAYFLAGYVSTAKLANRLEAMGYKPKNIMGKTLVTIGVTVNDDFVGCGCPKAFNEFNVFYAVDEKGDGKMQLVPDLSVTNHPQRQASMALKFGTQVDLGEVDHLGRAGFEVKDRDGNVLVRATSGIAMPKPRVRMASDAGFHSLGGGFQGQSLQKKFYRINNGKPLMGFRPFVRGMDKVEINQESEIGKTLKHQGFKPLFWQTVRVRDGRAWIPAQQP